MSFDRNCKDQRDPVQTTRTGVRGAIDMLGLARRLRAPISQASTSEAYVDPLIHPKVALADGLEETIACFKHSLELA